MYSSIHTKIISGIETFIPSKMKEMLQYEECINKRGKSKIVRKYSKNMKSFVKTNKKEIILFSKVHNEQDLLHYWIEYYKVLGVNMMVIILNNSTDKSLEILLNARSSQLKIEILIDNRDFYKTEAEWASELPKIYGLHHWCVNVDIDEFLKFQCSNLPTMIKYLVYNNQFCLPTYLLNLYTRNDFKTTKNIEEYFKNVYYDLNTITKRKKKDKYNQKEFDLFEDKHNVYKRLHLKHEYYNIKREIKKISLFYMFSVKLNVSGGFHHIYYLKENKKYIFSFINSRNAFYENDQYIKIEINYKKSYHGILLHLFEYKKKNLQSKFKSKLPIFYDKNISKKLDVKKLPYFYEKKLIKTNNINLSINKIV